MTGCPPCLALLLAGMLVLISLSTVSAAPDWQPAAAPLLTRWAREVSPTAPLPEYPRPQMVRRRWQSLNGLWDYAIAPREQREFDVPAGKILVPFPVESALSGVGRRVEEQQRLWYRCWFLVPREWRRGRVLLHFGAVDWEAEVRLNGRVLGTHRGGYDGFSFDITPALRGSEDEQELEVAVWDPTDAGPQPRGKQVRRPEGIWYTPTTGIWQTVWIEPVPEAHLRDLRLTPDLDGERLLVEVTTSGSADGLTVVASGAGAAAHGTVRGGAARLELPVRAPRAWSPERPHLYPLRLSLRRGSRAVDHVSSYFGMRKVSLGKDEAGVTRIFLNNRPYFMHGPLDQGFWPDGLYTAPTDAALRYDIEVTKQLGFNMARKHVKIEPARWYYWCDRLGLLVWQDMPNGDRHIGPRDPDLQRSPESAAQFERELARMIEGRGNHPSIVMWVPFNEGWGQYDTARIAELTRRLDPTRLVNSASGWTDRGVGDVHDIHVYPGPAAPPAGARAAVLGEYGGLGLPLEGHTWQARDNWGYRSFSNREDLATAYFGLQENLRPLLADPGLSAAVYTQTTDVEIEVNGLMTYDRAVLKLDARRVAEANRRLGRPVPQYVDVVPTSREVAQEWRYTLERPRGDWHAARYPDGAWLRGPGGFGTRGTPGAVVRTEWATGEIWLRREFRLAGTRLRRPHLHVHHDEDAEIYVNGVLAARVTGYTTGYTIVPLAEAARKALRGGTNVLAVYCRQTGGGQYIDVGLRDEAAPQR